MTDSFEPNIYLFMPAYHLILHTYGSWLPDQASGFNNRKIVRRLSKNDGLAEYYRSRMTQQAVAFSESQMELLLEVCSSSSQVSAYQIHAVAVVSNHMHIVISWNSEDVLSKILAHIKRQLTHILNQQAGQKSGQWFSRGAGASKIRDIEHLVELAKKYLPDHEPHVWIEDRIRLRMR